jgi:hypothetical protein
MINKGDIVVIYRKAYKGPFKYLVTRCILFFTTAWWLHEPTSKVYHAEIAWDNLSDSEFRAFTMEPPKSRFKDRRYSRKIIFRPKDLTVNYLDSVAQAYYDKNVGKKYDFFRILLMGLNWLFRTTWFTDHYKNKELDICSEFVARMYDRMNYPCSPNEPNSTTPDCIYDYCLAHPDRFEVVYDHRAQ